MDNNCPALPPFENQPDSGLPSDNDEEVTRSHVDPLKKFLEQISSAVNKEKLLYLMLGLLGVYSVYQQGKISSLEKDKSNMTKELVKEKNKPVWKKIFEDVVFHGTSAASASK